MGPSQGDCRCRPSPPGTGGSTAMSSRMPWRVAGPSPGTERRSSGPWKRVPRRHSSRARTLLGPSPRSRSSSSSVARFGSIRTGGTGARGPPPRTRAFSRYAPKRHTAASPRMRRARKVFPSGFIAGRKDAEIGNGYGRVARRASHDRQNQALHSLFLPRPAGDRTIGTRLARKSAGVQPRTETRLKSAKTAHFNHRSRRSFPRTRHSL